MKDENTRLIKEVAELRRRVSELEASEGRLVQARERMGSSLLLLRSLIDAGPDLFFIKDIHLRYRLMNAATIRFFERDETDILGQTDFDLMPDASAARACEQSDRQAVSEKEIVVTIEQIDGRTYETRKFPVIVEGKMIGVAGIVRDMTDQKRAEEALLEANKRLDEIIDCLPDATLVIDVRGKVIAWNKAMEEMTGIPAAEMMGKGDYEYALPFYGVRRPILINLVLQPRKEMESRYVSTSRRDETLTGEAYMPALRGGEVYLSGSASILRDSKGRIVGAIESIRDITDRRKAEEKYRGIFDNAVMGICQISPEGRILSANQAFARILGYGSPEEVIDAVTNVFGQLFADPGRYEELRRLLVQQDAIQMQEIELSKKDGSRILVHTSGRAVRDGAGKALYYEGTIQDITEISRLEAQLRQAQKMKAIGTLAGGIAHDFNNILASMMGYTEMAAKETRKENRQKYLQQVAKACERAKNLVDQILSFSRRDEQERKPLDIRLIVKEALTLLRATLPTTIEIKRKITSEDATVLADPTQIHQVLMNLCTNAAHAMRGGDGRLEVGLSLVDREDEPSALPADLKAGRYVRLIVRDNGCGIDPAIADKIFDPFFTTKKAREGTGLGLSVVYGIVKSLGGAIDVQSLPGQGATFTVYLPCVDPPDLTSQDEPPDAELRGREKILFVDDEDMIVSMARTYLKSLGYAMTATTSSSHALQVFTENPDAFDLVITDMTMPGMTGLSLARSILSMRPDLPVILCTGYSDAVSMADVRREGIREFCRKPVLMSVLGRLVRKVLDESEKSSINIK